MFVSKFSQMKRSANAVSEFACNKLIFSIYVFLWRSHKKNKYRWFKVEGFGDGYWVGGGW